MSDYVRTEEEQLAALRQWWKDNGTSLVLGVVLALGAIFGWKAYQQTEYDKRVASSLQFQQLLDASSGGPMGLSEEARTNIRFLSEEILKQDEQSAYSVYARLFQAREAVTEGELAQAEALLSEAMNVNRESALAPVIKARLARVLALAERTDEAIALLDVATSGSDRAYFQELKGDLLKGAGRPVEAREAYAAALAAIEAEGQDSRLIQMKLDDLAGV